MSGFTDQSTAGQNRLKLAKLTRGNINFSVEDLRFYRYKLALISIDMLGLIVRQVSKAGLNCSYIGFMDGKC